MHFEAQVKKNGGMASCSDLITSAPSLGSNDQFTFMVIHNETIPGGSLAPSAPPGLVVLGGLAPDGPLSSAETFGFEDDKCNIPHLPDSRYGLAAFKTSSNQLVVCGGWWESKLDSTDCLVLHASEGQWVREMFKGHLFGEGVRGVATFEGTGTYIFHSTSASILPSGSDTWIRGPETPVETECACKLSDSSFAIVGSNSGNNVLEFSITNKRWEPIDTWPEMRTKRKGPGCAATPYYLLVAGGVTDQGEVLASVEIFWLQSRALGRGRDMSSPRSFFTMIPVGLKRPKILAIGGRNGEFFLETTEFWEEEDNQWERGPQLGTGRSAFGALMIHGEYACSAIESQQPELYPATEKVAPLMNTQSTGRKNYLERWRQHRLLNYLQCVPHTILNYVELHLKHFGLI